MTTQADFAAMLEKSEELNLQYKTKIIELENQLNHQKIRAKEYENKFKDALLQSEFQEGQDLLEKLCSKEKELSECRREVLELNRRLANTSHAPTQTDLIALARENQELMDNIDEIKNAAISAIMLKEEEIEELNKTISRYQYMENELKIQYEKYDNLDREYDAAMQEKDEEIRELTDRIARERENFLNKLFAIQKETSQEENHKQRLLEKATYLEGTVERSEIIISEYETKLAELESQISEQKLVFEKQTARLELELEGYKEDVKLFERDQKALSKVVEQFKNKERQARENIKRLTQDKQDLIYKLNLKKKKDNKAIKDKITSSFAGVAKNNPVYSSFAFRQKDSIVDDEDETVNPKHLGDYPEIQEFDGLIENFSFQDLGRKKSQQFNQLPKQPVKEIPISQLMVKKKNPEISETTKAEPIVPLNAQQHTGQLSKDIENYKQTILRLQTEKKQVQTSLIEAYNQIEKLNVNINNLTAELQGERKCISELRQQMKKTKKESQLIVEVQSLTLHVQKLEMDMVASKLKYAEEAEFLREKYNRQKVIWTQKLVQLTDQIAKQDLLIQSKGEQKKKKKGFFG